MAGALRVRLFGPIWAGGVQVNERYGGDPAWGETVTPRQLWQALWIIALAGLLALAMGLAAAWGGRLLLPLVTAWVATPPG